MKGEGFKRFAAVRKDTQKLLKVGSKEAVERYVGRRIEFTGATYQIFPVTVISDAGLATRDADNQGLGAALEKEYMLVKMTEAADFMDGTFDDKAKWLRESVVAWGIDSHAPGMVERDRDIKVAKNCERCAARKLWAEWGELIEKNPDILEALKGRG